MASELGVQTIQHTNGTDAMTIDSNGVITKSVVPSFRIGRTIKQVVTSAATDTTLLFNDTNTDNCFVQGGMSLSSGVVTVPVAGVYQFNANIRFSNVGSGYVQVFIVINNDKSNNKDTYIINGSPASNYDTLTGSDVYKLDANDNVRIIVYASADNNFDINDTSTFSGVLIG